MNPDAYQSGFNNALLTVLAIGFLMEGDNPVTVTVETLCRNTRLSEGALMDALDYLRDMGAIEYVRTGDSIEADLIGRPQGGAS